MSEPDFSPLSPLPSVQPTPAWALVLALVLCGCSGRPAVDPPHAPDCHATTFVRERDTTLNAGTSYLHLPVQTAWDGRVVRLNWSADPHLLSGLEVLATWNQTELPAHQGDLRLGIRYDNATSFDEHWAHGPVNGPSPLDLKVARVARHILDQPLDIDLGATQNATLPVSKSIEDIHVHLTVTEQYRCPGQA